MNTKLEVSRRNLIGKTKVQSPERYNRRLRYSTMSIPEIDEDELMYKDNLVMSVQVGAYTDTLAYSGVCKRIIQLVKQSPNRSLTRRIVVRAMNEQVDIVKDVYVRCTCMDFQCRYGYVATKHHYIWGTPENRPANITNPHDDIGAVCKHLACILSNKKWLVKAASVVNDFIHDNYDEFLSVYKLTSEDFGIDENAYNAAIAGAIKREQQRLPVDLYGIASKLYYPDTLESDLFDLLNRRGWQLRVDEDLSKPILVYISKSLESLDDPEDSEDVYKFEVVPAGTRVKLNWVKD